MQTQGATEEITKKIDALQRDAAGSADAVHRISQAIEAIRPVFEHRQRRRRRAERDHRRGLQQRGQRLEFIISVGESAAEIDAATKAAETHGENVASAGKAVTAFAQKLKSRCAILLGRVERDDPPQDRAAALPSQARDRARRCCRSTKSRWTAC